MDMRKIVLNIITFPFLIIAMVFCLFGLLGIIMVHRIEMLNVNWHKSKEEREIHSVGPTKGMPKL